MQATREITISARSHQYGLGWTNQPVRRGSTLVIAPVQAPDYTGTKREMLAELERAVRGNHGNDWRVALFANGQPVALDSFNRVRQIREILSQRGDITVDVYVED